MLLLALAFWGIAYYLLGTFVIVLLALFRELDGSLLEDAWLPMLILLWPLAVVCVVLSRIALGLSWVVHRLSRLDRKGKKHVR